MSIYLFGSLFNHQPDMQTAIPIFSDQRAWHEAKISRDEIEISFAPRNQSLEPSERFRDAAFKVLP